MGIAMGGFGTEEKCIDDEVNRRAGEEAKRRAAERATLTPFSFPWAMAHLDAHVRGELPTLPNRAMRRRKLKPKMKRWALYER